MPRLWHQPQDASHNYLKRHRCDGRYGLADRSRRPKSSTNATADSVEALRLKERLKHPI